jgi:hypothetical protein
LSLLLTGLAVAGGVVIGRVLAASLLKRTARARQKQDSSPDGEGENVVKKPKQDSDDDTFSGFPCALGDVIMRTTGEEAWLAGAVLLSEHAPVAALFVSPDAGGDRMVFVRALPTVELTWLSALEQAELPVGNEPPNALEHANVRFDRIRRLPLRARRLGSGAPDLGEQVVLGEYAATGADRIVVFASPGRTRSFRGTLLESGTYDVLPGGKSTLDPP